MLNVFEFAVNYQIVLSDSFWSAAAPNEGIFNIAFTFIVQSKNVFHKNNYFL